MPGRGDCPDCAFAHDPTRTCAVALGLMSHRFCALARRQERYRDLIAAHTPGAPPIDCLIEGYISSWQGYGQVAEWLGRGLEGRGRRVGYRPIKRDGYYLPTQRWIEARVTEAEAACRLILAVPQHPTPAGRVVRFTMWETSRVGREAAAELNKAALVCVPCDHNRDCLRDSGVRAPIAVVPMGVDASEGYFDDGSWPDDGVFSVGMAARMAHGGVRKGLNEGIAAFRDAFAGADDVRLELKVFPDCLKVLRIPDDPRIVVTPTPYTPAEMAAWYRRQHVLLVPSKGEGWGLHTHQAMACGRPAIAALYSGTAAFADPTCAYPLGYALEPAGEFYALPGAEWAVPRHDDMVAQLRRAHGDRGELRRLGRAAAARAAEFPWSRTGAELERALVDRGLLAAAAAPAAGPAGA